MLALRSVEVGCVLVDFYSGFRGPGIGVSVGGEVLGIQRIAAVGVEVAVWDLRGGL